MNSVAAFIVTTLAASIFMSVPTFAQQQTQQVGEATISLGGGAAFLYLPSIDFVKQRDGGSGPVISRIKSSDDTEEEAGWSINGSINVPLNGNPLQTDFVSLRGFWAEYEFDDTVNCVAALAQRPGCNLNSIVDVPARPDNVGLAFPGTSQIVTGRDVEHWSLSLETGWNFDSNGMLSAQGNEQSYIGLGLDFRGIEQDINLGVVNQFSPLRNVLSEQLDTHYYGGYVVVGGSLLPLLGGSDPQSTTGFQLLYRLQAGVYFADADYDGVSDISQFESPRNLSLSESEAAFIGGLEIEMRQQISNGVSIWLLANYEYYSWVPKMRYNDFDFGIMTGPNIGTSIDDEDAHSARISAGLTFSLGGAGTQN